MGFRREILTTVVAGGIIDKRKLGLAMAEEDPSKTVLGRYPNALALSLFTYVYGLLGAVHAVYNVTPAY